MEKIVTLGPWSLKYEDGDAYGEISHPEFGDVEVIGYMGRPVPMTELAEDLEEWVEEQGMTYLTELTYRGDI